MGRLSSTKIVIQQGTVQLLYYKRALVITEKTFGCRQDKCLCVSRRKAAVKRLQHTPECQGKSAIRTKAIDGGDEFTGW